MRGLGRGRGRGEACATARAPARAAAVEPPITPIEERVHDYVDPAVPTQVL